MLDSCENSVLEDVGSFANEKHELVEVNKKPFDANKVYKVTLGGGWGDLLGLLGDFQEPKQQWQASL